MCAGATALEPYSLADLTVHPRMRGCDSAVGAGGVCVNGLKLSQMDRISAYLNTDRITAYRRQGASRAPPLSEVTD